MQKNLYFRNVLRRRNILGDALLGFFLAFASYPRLLLEVFIRRNFGDRYFSLASVIGIVAFFLFFPLLLWKIYASAFKHVSIWEMFKQAPGIYIFLCIFLAVGIWHHLQIRQGPSVFNFEKFSLSAGDIHPLFFKIQPFGKKPSVRLIETVYEPLFFLIIGWIISKLDTIVGYLIITASIFYALGYLGAYKRGDDFVKDKIDEMIMNGEMENAFVNDEDNNKKGVRFRAEKPSSRDMRSDLAKEFVIEGEEAADAI